MEHCRMKGNEEADKAGRDAINILNSGTLISIHL